MWNFRDGKAILSTIIPDEKLVGGALFDGFLVVWLDGHQDYLIFLAAGIMAAASAIAGTVIPDHSC